MKGLKSKLNNPKMKKYTNLFVSRAKVFLLAGLLGGMTACKDELEPEIAPQAASTTTNNSVFDNTQYTQDSFMQHMSNVGATSFYADKYGEFTPSLNGDIVDGLYFSDYGHNSAHGWYYGSNGFRFLNRNDGTSTDGSAAFNVDNYVFSINVGGKTWRIENIPASTYHDTFEGMSPETFAQFARDSLTAAGVDATYVNSVYAAIAAGNGTWSESDNHHMGLLSKGPKANLIYSDFGFKQGPIPVFYEAGKYETTPFIGGETSKRVQAPSTPMSFMGKAYVSVMPTNDYSYKNMRGGMTGRGLQVFETDSMMAKYSFGSDADTLRMMFNDWYTVTVVRQHSNNNFILGFAGYPAVSNFPQSVWGTQWPQVNYEPMSSEVAPNGIEYSSYASESQDYSAYVSLSEPLFYGNTNGSTTGLENVYCAPKRAAANYGTAEPEEVVICGDYKEYRPDMVSTKGVEISFVFGGTKYQR